MTWLVVALAVSPLELPHVVVRGSPQVTVPQRAEWWEPPWESGVPPPLPPPSSPRVGGSTGPSPLRRPPPAGPSARLGGGWQHAEVVGAMGERAGGLAIWGQRRQAGRVGGQGLGGSATAEGRWGRMGLSAEQWRDDLPGVGLDTWWKASASYRREWGTQRQVGVDLWGSGPQGGSVHARGTYATLLPRVPLRAEVRVGDRELRGLVGWARGVAAAWLGAGMVEDWRRTRWAWQGEARLGPWGRKGIWTGVTLSRSLQVREGVELRESFPAGGGAEDWAELIAWSAQVSVAARLGWGAGWEARAAKMEITTAPAWVDSGGTWEVAALAGRGDKAEGSLWWRGGRATVRAGGIWQRLVPEGGGSWPLVPEWRWWVSAERAGTPAVRLEARSDHGLWARSGRKPDSGLFSVHLWAPWRSGWEAWVRTDLSWGWKLMPYPRGVSVGLSWSQKRPHQEGLR